MDGGSVGKQPQKALGHPRRRLPPQRRLLLPLAVVVIVVAMVVVVVVVLQGHPPDQIREDKEDPKLALGVHLRVAGAKGARRLSRLLRLDLPEIPGRPLPHQQHGDMQGSLVLVDGLELLDGLPEGLLVAKRKHNQEALAKLDQRVFVAQGIGQDLHLPGDPVCLEGHVVVVVVVAAGLRGGAEVGGVGEKSQGDFRGTVAQHCNAG